MKELCEIEGIKFFDTSEIINRTSELNAIWKISNSAFTRYASLTIRFAVSGDKKCRWERIKFFRVYDHRLANIKKISDIASSSQPLGFSTPQCHARCRPYTDKTPYIEKHPSYLYMGTQKHGQSG